MLGKVGESAGGMMSMLGGIGLAAGGLSAIAGAVGGLASSMVYGNAQMETYETQLGTLMGGADKAKERLAELAKFGAETPFELPELVKAEKILLGFGLTGEKAMALTGKSGEALRTVLGDVAAGTGASFEEIALNMGKMSAGATGEAISRFQEMGVVTREQLAGMGIEFAKSGELLSPLPVAMAAMAQVMGEKFGGGMAALSQTFSGQMSTLSDTFNQTKIQLMAPIFDVLKNSLAGLNALLSSAAVQDKLQEVAALISQGVSVALAVAGEWIGKVQAAFTAAMPAFQMVAAFLSDNIGPVLAGLAAIIGSVL